jgi:nucleoside-diphosphate-sugar epimerase
MAEALIVGCGYTGVRLGRRLASGGHRVVGTTRSRDRVPELRAAGIDARLLELGEPGAARALGRESPDVVFYLAPPIGEDPGAEIEAVLRVLGRAPLEAFVYASSTSVYGDRGGEVVDASTLPRPDSPAGRARLATERRVLQAGWTFDARPRIARIGGIYGPGRTLREAIREGRYRAVEGVEAWSNRIHVDDLVEGLVAVWRRGENGRIYDLVDDEPHLSDAFARFVAERSGLELRTLTLEEARAAYGPDRLARKLGSKRVSNRRMREELGVELRYPTYREGVPAALDGAGRDAEAREDRVDDGA